MLEVLATGSVLTVLVALIAAGICLSLGMKYAKATRHRTTLLELARRRARRISETLRMFRMAEEIAGLGVWQYFPNKDYQKWSQGMKLLFGMDANEELMAGDMETVLSSNGIDLIGQVGKAQSEEELTGQYSIHRLDGQNRVLSLRANRVTNRKGETRNYTAVFMDVTDQAQKVHDLEHSREEAMRAAQEARKLADTDPLTGIANRRRVMTELDMLVMQSREQSKPLVLVIFDIDHFKQVNDQYGHPAGDAVIKRIAEITSAQARKQDIVGRIGGEEFVWVVPDADINLARVLSERLRQAISIESGVGDVPPVTVSVGFAAPVAGDTSLTLFARADEALYVAKDSGRNTVRMAA